MTPQAAQLHASIAELQRLAAAARAANERELLREQHDAEFTAWLRATQSDGLSTADVDRYAEQRGATVVPQEAVDAQP